MSGNRYWYRRGRRHLGMAVVAAAMVWAVYLLTPPPDVRHRLSMATAYVGLAFLGGSLWLGPWNVLRRRPNPVSFDLRRDMGIWAGGLALFHTGVGLTVHLRGRMWMYFVKGLHPVRIQNNEFGLANYAGGFAAILFVMLLAISNDFAVRSLGTKSWKSLQRWIYGAAALTVMHGILFQLVEKRHLMWVVAFTSMILVVLSIQMSGYLRLKSCGQRLSVTDKE